MEIKTTTLKYNKEYSDKYIEQNKERLTQYHKEYYQKHKEKYNEYNRNYNKNYYEKNKQKFLEKTECQICGKHYNIPTKSNHYKTQYHLNAQKLLDKEKQMREKQEKEINDLKTKLKNMKE